MDIKKIALLIDADNVSFKYIKGIIDEISTFGVPTYKRIYGDWTKPEMNTWKPVLLEYSITPIQQYGYTTGKNATDSAMIIDAMDILYSSNVDGFCIVSSDSDFTRLAARLRESGMFVMGMGEKKTPTAFKAACETFKYLEVLKTHEAINAVEAKSDKEKLSEFELKAVVADLNDLIKSIKKIVVEHSDEEGWMYLSNLGGILSRQYADFDSRNYGYSNLIKMIKATKQFEVKASQSGKGIKHYLIRCIE